jgi:DeoR family transcriptional regulator, aga operon transcriptional repressor
MTQQQRLNALLDLVTARGTISIPEITEELDVSAATARRYLTALADQRLINRTHGGASVLGGGYELPIQYKAGRQAEAKTSIGRAAAALVKPGSAVGLNGGTTTTEVARALGLMTSAGGDDGGTALTLVTNALNIAYELSVRPQIKIVVTGGVSRRQSYELVGPLVGRALSDVALDLVILGVDGLSAQFGATTVSESEAEVSQRFIDVAARVVVVADATKLERVTFGRICPLHRIDTLVTDAPAGAEFGRGLEAAGVEVIVADPA